MGNGHGWLGAVVARQAAAGRNGQCASTGGFLVYIYVYILYIHMNFNFPFTLGPKVGLHSIYNYVLYSKICGNLSYLNRKK